MKVVLDTNVFLSALQSRRGASFEVMRLLREDRWQMVLSNHLLHNLRQARKFGILVITPRQFLEELRKET